MGGTISAKGNHPFDYKDYTSGYFKYDDFLKDMPELHELADLSFDSFEKISSTEVTTNHWIALRKKIIEFFEKEAGDGVVITHGTNTLEETAYFLHLTVPFKQPIVLVGAQRPFTAISTDAHLNLYQAIQVAAGDESYGKGALVVLNNEISSAREVSKRSTYRLDAFQSNKHGFLGVVDSDHSVQFYRQPVRKHTFQSEFSTLQFERLPEVEIVYSYAGAREFLIDSIVQSGIYKGIVTAGTGAGLVSPKEHEALQRATDQGIVVVRSSRVGSGRVVPVRPYEKNSFVAGDDLPPQKARILLMLSLLKYKDLPSLQHVFNTY